MCVIGVCSPSLRGMNKLEKIYPFWQCGGFPCGTVTRHAGMNILMHILWLTYMNTFPWGVDLLGRWRSIFSALVSAAS